MALTVYGSPYVDGTDLVANWPAASLTVAQSIDAAGYYIGRGNNTQTGSYTTVLTDAGKVITMSNASATTVTIPANSSVAYVIGTRINILNLGAGACTPTAGAGVTINGSITALATNSSAAVIKTATNTWSYVPFGEAGAATLTSADVTSTTGSPTITTSGGNTIYKFTGSGSITLGKAGLASAVVVAGGGGGGVFYGAGGGGGGMLVNTSTYLPSGSNTVVVGAGGVGGNGQAVNIGIDGNNGLASSIAQIYAPGGGGGGCGSNKYNVAQVFANPGLNGGSGGGGGSGTNAHATPNFSGGAGISGLGFSGGAGTATDGGSGGGGGAGAVGVAAAVAAGGNGGAGLANSITGSSVTYAGGGGGTGSTQGTGGTGGGSNGVASGTATAGGTNLGGGAGGCNQGAAGNIGGVGGSGVVIISVTT